MLGENIRKARQARGLRSGGVDTALHAAEVAIENAGGTVTAVRAE